MGRGRAQCGPCMHCTTRDHERRAPRDLVSHLSVDSAAPGIDLDASPRAVPDITASPPHRPGGRPLTQHTAHGTRAGAWRAFCSRRVTTVAWRGVVVVVVGGGLTAGAAGVNHLARLTQLCTPQSTAAGTVHESTRHSAPLQPYSPPNYSTSAFLFFGDGLVCVQLRLKMLHFRVVSK